jgi:hypothetical protein
MPFSIDVMDPHARTVTPAPSRSPSLHSHPFFHRHCPLHHPTFFFPPSSSVRRPFWFGVSDANIWTVPFAITTFPELSSIFGRRTAGHGSTSSAAITARFGLTDTATGSSIHFFLSARFRFSSVSDTVCFKRSQMHPASAPFLTASFEESTAVSFSLFPPSALARPSPFFSRTLSPFQSMTDTTIQSHLPIFSPSISRSETLFHPATFRGSSTDSIVSSSGGSIGLIAGIVAGVLFLALVLIAALILRCRRSGAGTPSYSAPGAPSEIEFVDHSFVETLVTFTDAVTLDGDDTSFISAPAQLLSGFSDAPLSFSI